MGKELQLAHRGGAAVMEMQTRRRGDAEGKTRIQVNSDVHDSCRPLSDYAGGAHGVSAQLKGTSAVVTEEEYEYYMLGFVQIRDETHTLLLGLVCHFQEVKREPLCEITHPAQTFFFFCEIANELFFFT